MTVTLNLNSPLECHLRDLCSTRPNDFPHRGGTYFSAYVTMKQALADKYYANTAAGLARQGARFTKHDISHIDDVIHTAGQMIGFGSEAKTPAYTQLNPLEVFVLLLAILLHDAGNAVDREGHEKLVSEILREIANGSPLIESFERRIITSIARAHGGKLDSGDKDTIRGLITHPTPNVGSIPVRARLLAAILRLSDELSENPRRADEQAIIRKGAPDESVLANLYCKWINPHIDYLSKSARLTFGVEHSILDRVFKIPKDTGLTEEILFIDYVAHRLEKCETERRYCNNFLAGFSGIEQIKVDLVIYDQDNEIESIPLVLEEKGYPSTSISVRQLEPRFDAAALRDKHSASSRQRAAQ